MRELERGHALRAIVLLCVSIGATACNTPATRASELRITAEEYGFRMRDSIPAGLVHITLRNAGADIHEAVLVHFTNSILTAAMFADSVRADIDFPSNAENTGGAALTMPGDSSGTWLRLAPGHYAVLCWKGNHMSRGMARDLWVVESHAAEVPPPKATRELTLAEFAFTLDKPFTAGRQVLHVRNAGTEDHEGDMYKTTPTAGLRELVAWFEAGEHGLPPLAPVAGFGDIDPGKEVWAEMHLTPGHYFILCRVPAKSDKKPHSAHGMIKEFSIE